MCPRVDREYLSAKVSRMGTDVICPRSGVRRDYPLNRGPHEFIEEQVRRTSDVPALTMGAEQISYQELNSRANRLAHFLCRQGLNPNAWWCVSRSLVRFGGQPARHLKFGRHLPAARSEVSEGPSGIDAGRFRGLTCSSPILPNPTVCRKQPPELFCWTRERAACRPRRRTSP